MFVTNKSKEGRDEGIYPHLYALPCILCGERSSTRSEEHLRKSLFSAQDTSLTLYRRHDLGET